VIDEMNTTAVRKTVVVEASQERCFEVFTTRFDSWWPRSHHIGGVDMAEAVMERRAGGRWYERGVDGSECSWGQVLAFEPPGRLVLVWQINGQWQYDPTLHTEVEITFTELGPRRTEVTVEHRNLDRFGDAADAMREAFSSEGGWTGLLDAFKTAANASTD
jgi:uncharacterized protein YndB with AHSA1/START domain